MSEFWLLVVWTLINSAFLWGLWQRHHDYKEDANESFKKIGEDVKKLDKRTK